MSDRSLGARVESLLSGVRFGKFVSVGVVGAIVDTTTLFVLVQFFDLPAVWVNLFTIELAILTMFVINEHWTFAEHGREGKLRSRLLRSHAVRATGTTVQIVVFTLLYEFVAVSLVDGVDLWLLVAKGTGIGLGMLVNYVFESLFTWRVHTDESG
jgi:putative flippase GtrA